MERDERIAREALALWIAMFNEPPIVSATGSEMLEAFIKALPNPPYVPPDNSDRLVDPS